MSHSHPHPHSHSHSHHASDSSPPASISCMSLSPSLSKARKRFRRFFSLPARCHRHHHHANDEPVPLPLPPLQYAIHEMGPLLLPATMSAGASSSSLCSVATTASTNGSAPTNHRRHVSAASSSTSSLKSILVVSSRRSHTPLSAPPAIANETTSPAPPPPPEGDRRPPMSSFSSVSDSGASDLDPASISGTSTLVGTSTLAHPPDGGNGGAMRGSADSGLAPSVTSAAQAASDALAAVVRGVLLDEPSLPSLDHRVSPQNNPKRKSVRIDLDPPAVGRAPKYDRSPDPANLSERLRHGRVTAAEHRRVLDEVLVLKRVARESYHKAIGSVPPQVPPPASPTSVDFSVSISEALAGSVSDTKDVVGALVATLAEFVVKAAPSAASRSTSLRCGSKDVDALDDERVDLGDHDDAAVPGQYPPSPLPITEHLYKSPVPTPATPGAQPPPSSTTLT